MKSENTAKVYGKDLSISTKHTIEISNLIRGKSLDKSRRMLVSIIEQKSALPFTRFNKDMPHRKGKMMSGRYPQKACLAVLKLLNNLEANAQDKGLDPALLTIKSIIPNLASRPMHQGRHRSRKMKRTHLEITAEESKENKKQEKK